MDVHVSRFIDYVISNTQPLFDCPKDDLLRLLTKQVNAASIQKFMTDSQVSVLQVSREVVGESVDNPTYAMHVDLETAYRGSRASTILFVKRPGFQGVGPFAESSATDGEDEQAPTRERLLKHFGGHIMVLTLGFLDGEHTPFQLIHQLIQQVVVPLTKSFKPSSQDGSSTSDALDAMLTSVRSRSMELSVSLQTLQQSVDIPEVALVHETEIEEVCARARQEGRKPLADEVRSSEQLISRMGSHVRKWRADCLRLCELDRAFDSGSAAAEVAFWSGKYAALQKVDAALSAPEVDLVLEVLRSSKTFGFSVVNESRQAVKTALLTAQSHVALLEDLQVDKLIAATDLQTLAQAVHKCFATLKRLRSSQYPVSRAVALVDALSRDVTELLVRVVPGTRLMACDMEAFGPLISGCLDVLKVFEEETQDLRDIVRSINKAANLRQTAKFNLAYTELAARLKELDAFRKSHHSFREVVGRVLADAGEASAEMTTLREVGAAFRLVASTDVLDVSKSGQEAWTAALSAYHSRVDRIEGQLASRLRETLGASRTTAGKLRIFQRYSVLLGRHRIRGAVQEYQQTLVQEIEKELNQLQTKFREPYEGSHAHHFALTRDIPEASGVALWARQLERRLDACLDKLRSILGSSWESHTDGARLKQQAEAFRRKLPQLSSSVGDLISFVKALPQVDEGRIFRVTQKSRLVNGQTVTSQEIGVNFDTRALAVFKECRLVTNALGERIPYSTRTAAAEAKQRYPFVIVLNDALRSYTQTVALVQNSPLAPLLAGSEQKIRQLLFANISRRWDYERLEILTKELSEGVFSLHASTQYAIDVAALVDSDLRALSSAPLKEKQGSKEKAALHTNPFAEDGERPAGRFGRPAEASAPSVAAVLDRVQSRIDELALRGYSNLSQWVAQVDERVERVLLDRAAELLRTWTSEFEGWPSKGTSLVQEGVILSLKAEGASLICQPPVEAGRQTWTSHVHASLQHLLGMPRLDPSRYDRQRKSSSSASDTLDYTSLLPRLSGDLISKTFATLDSVINRANEHVEAWLQLRGLWDISPAQATEALEEGDVDAWAALLAEIRRTRGFVDSGDVRTAFGPLVIDASSAQSRVQLRLDQWHRDVTALFAAKVADRTARTLNEVSALRLALERLSTDGAGGDVAAFVSTVQGARKSSSKWSEALEGLRASQKLLERQRFAFPSSWLWVNRIDGEWEALSQVLQRRGEAMDAQLPLLRKQVAQEERQHAIRLKLALTEWASSKPMQGSVKPQSAMEVLTQFESRFGKLQEERAKVDKARQALDLDSAGHQDPLPVVVEELQGLRDVWRELASVVSRLDALRETPWASVVPKLVRRGLDEVGAALKALPPKLKAFEAYEAAVQMVDGHVRTGPLVAALRADAVRDRHWRELVGRLGLRVALKDLTLGQLWDCDLLSREKAINEVLAHATSEAALEDFFTSVRQTWQTQELQLVSFKGRTKLIKGWQDLMGLLDEHLATLSSMKASPHLHVFEEEHQAWDGRLSKLRLLLEQWMDVQRRWVYLEGVFFGSADIQQQLAAEHARFRLVDQDFLAIMKRVAQKPLVLDVAQQEGLLRQLERLSDQLVKVQKALGEFLETQRLQFARFFFLGDDDLLDLLGNARDPLVAVRHLPKLFAGLAGLSLDAPDGSTESVPLSQRDAIFGMRSREQEEVAFVAPVRISEDPAVHAWLRRVETAMQLGLKVATVRGLNQYHALTDAAHANGEVIDWALQQPAQTAVLAVQAAWTHAIQTALQTGKGDLQPVLSRSLETLGHLAQRVLSPGVLGASRLKLEQLVTVLVHQRDTTRQLLADRVANAGDFNWLASMRAYLTGLKSGPAEEVAPLVTAECCMADARLPYGFEYLGVQERLVQTPLTDRAFLTLTQALHMRLGGNPFGPAGTGKTETVKALGAQLGRFTLVFCCDEAFDVAAMGRIFVGLCQVGAWGCFDEFNRLEEGILSAVSEQILIIQRGLRERTEQVSLEGRKVLLSPQVGIFVTMNPGYAGRSALPDNLKLLFREVAMVRPDKQLIGQVTLFSQGFASAETLASKVVALFDLCADQLSAQPHYDFGLRSLKSVLSAAGALKRAVLADGHTVASAEENEREEIALLLRAVCDTLVPRLIREDAVLLRSLVEGVFPGHELRGADQQNLIAAAAAYCRSRHMAATPGFLEKVAQLAAIQRLSHGVMLVGPVGSGKSSVWRCLLAALEATEGTRGEAHVLDPKACSKEELYGRLDPTTLEWTDGLFTELLRRAINDSRPDRRQWIVFDGDVDPEWAENLNSVLDDNKLLTLPNGERLAMPPSVRLIFEVDTLKNATPATVSRCGMVWFTDQVVTPSQLVAHHIERLANGNSPLDETPAAASPAAPSSETPLPATDPSIGVRAAFAKALRPLCEPQGLVEQAISLAAKHNHIMTFTPVRIIEALFSLIRRGARRAVELNEDRPDFPLEAVQVETFASRWLVFALCWACGGSLDITARQTLTLEICHLAKSFEGVAGLSLPSGLSAEATLLEFDISVEHAEWRMWAASVPRTEVDEAQAQDANTVVPTVDTLRHRAVLQGWLEERRPFLLCGPPGSGKSMTLNSTLKALSGIEVASLNFSSGSTPELLLQTFQLYCETVKTAHGLVMRPLSVGRWLVVFCDEVNLPTPDKYGTQKVIAFMRQLVERGGFWRPSDNQWVSLERIQFVGACNPPTDAGRSPLTDRFLRHAPVLFVDFPSESSLLNIYGAFMTQMTKPYPELHTQAGPIARLMVDFYLRSQRRFTVDQQPHYLFSPRELTRWKLACQEYLAGCQASFHRPTLVEFARLVAHEALRIFTDRLVEQEEREWSERTLDEVVAAHLPSLPANALERPLLFTFHSESNPNVYAETSLDSLRAALAERLPRFKEEHPVDVVLFDEALQHVARIDRVLRQPLGHLLLVGSSGAGKTLLPKLVAFLNDMQTFVVRPGRGYDTAAFEVDLRSVMKLAGVKEQRVVFLFDESNALGPAFLERMNALLASGEVPGLYEGDELAGLLTECRAAYGTSAEGDDGELFRRFTSLVQRNLHIVFTMNPDTPEFQNRQATSPALFNRCVIDWVGDWSEQALEAVALALTADLPVEPEAVAHAFPSSTPEEAEAARRDLLASALVGLHREAGRVNRQLAKASKRASYVSPRDFLDLLRHLRSLFLSKRGGVRQQLNHLTSGLEKLRDTERQVGELQSELAIKETELKSKEADADRQMSLMVASKGEAEKAKNANEKLIVQLETKTKDIAIRSAAVQEQLAEVLPLVEKAKQAVSSLERKHFVEMASMTNPPALAKSVLEAILMLKRDLPSPPSWEEIRKELRGSLVSDILNEVPGNEKPIPDRLVAKLSVEYVDTWSMEAVRRASLVAEILADWLKSKLMHQRMLGQVEPLQKEIRVLEDQRNSLQAELQVAEATIGQLENEIEGYKHQFSLLIAQAEAIKIEKRAVEAKVDRSRRLLANLESEQGRWSETAEQLKAAEGGQLGLSVLGAAFSTYLGAHDQSVRDSVLSAWRQTVKDKCLRLPVEDASAVSKDELLEFLSTPQQRVQWSAAGLPDDLLAQENAALLERTERYPLVLDPSGQALNFLKTHLPQMTVTSLSDPSVLRHLENAARFGGTILVQGLGSKSDPLLNALLNKEVVRQGGRVLTFIGDKQVDLAPGFRLFLSAADPDVALGPDLNSRVTLVNFATTPASLTAQCLALALKAERPDVERQREEVLRLRGEYQLRVRELEASLLDALASAQGNLLENDVVVTSLETLKAEAHKVAAEMAKVDHVVRDVNEASAVYAPLASAAAQTFFSIARLSAVSPLYRSGLRAFLQTFRASLATDRSVLPRNAAGEAVASLEGLSDPKERLGAIFDRFFALVFARTAKGLLQTHRLPLALRLGQIRSATDTPPVPNGAAAKLAPCGPLPAEDLNLLLKGVAQAPSAQAMNALQQALATAGIALPASCLAAAQAVLAALPTFPSLVAAAPQLWKLVATASAPELLFVADSDLPAGSSRSEGASEEQVRPLIDAVQGKGPAHRNLLISLVMNALRLDRVPAALRLLTNSLLGASFLDLASDAALDIGAVLASEAGPVAPLLLVSAPGFDQTSRVIDAHRDLQRPAHLLHTVAMGEGAAEKQAIELIRSLCADPQGHWLVLRNVHLARSWLGTAHQTLCQAPKVDPGFRLILTAERAAAPLLPASVLGASVRIVSEPPMGLKASLQRCVVSLLPAKISDRLPVERARLHLQLAVLHATLIERLRFAPLGFSKQYEFSDGDFLCAQQLIDRWVDAACRGAEVQTIESIPWAALQTLLVQVVYGGRVDQRSDLQALQALVARLFCAEAILPGARLNLVSSSAHESDVLRGPETCRKRADIVAWVEKLPSLQRLAWIGLAPAAERLPLEADAKAALELWLSSQVEVASTAASGKGAGGWLAELAPRVASLVQTVKEARLAVGFPALPRFGLEGESLRQAQVFDPLWRCVEREVNTLRATQVRIEKELVALLAVCEGKAKLTNLIRSIGTSLRDDHTPATWLSSYPCAPLSAGRWISDLNSRCVTFRSLTERVIAEGATQSGLQGLERLAAILRRLPVGRLCHPEAYLTATRQLVALATGVSVESLQLHVRVLVGAEAENPLQGHPAAFVWDGICLRGASYDAADEGSLHHGSSLEETLGPCRFEWRPQQQELSPAQEMAGSRMLEVPVFLNDLRRQTVATVRMAGQGERDVWAVRGVCLTTWNN